uniref:Cytochrome c oxidase subunit 2 n=1 Tax=Macrotrachela quadricornifera TaxID=104788 RepID=J7KHV5_9BILA|nr:cytochrome c oxidase subunit 2 [Macrotrachela quadricornifera]AFQ96952.1 cytochrome c oxidase subunit 2 [Macrotrachela quadricornifera]AFQ96953.1 cytochrome c oxidase subunit 2 [Macrotrachela quadricornifera]AFQ96954.1 cytochrome c oxidase subunit 2 [Macrotrachela quadricornifera]AFQ96957.1 cytochrome c oxidase subunit 2 [Macrotrachela quadricornifera]
MMFWGMYSLQDALSVTMEQIIYFHDYLMMVMTIIMCVVAYFLGFVLFTKTYSSSIVADHLVETFWTILPIVVLIFLVYPSIYLLYLIDESSVEFLCTLKVIGHQWYWSYKMDGVLSLDIDSYMDADSAVRLMDVDNRVVVPAQEHIRALITSSDVMHSWALPALGVKMDAIPGRLNQFVFMVMLNSIIHGQCSEICGVNHSFMPIVLESVALSDLL